jgi:hypothetical protein
MGNLQKVRVHGAVRVRGRLLLGEHRTYHLFEVRVMMGVMDDPHVQFAGLCGMYGWEKDESKQIRNPSPNEYPEVYHLRRGEVRLEITRRNVENWDYAMMLTILRRGYVEDKE